jgi:hypothetical protein
MIGARLVLGYAIHPGADGRHGFRIPVDVASLTFSDTH